jgi:Glycosyl transferase family 21
VGDLRFRAAVRGRDCLTVLQMERTERVLSCTYLVPLRATTPPSRDLVAHLQTLARSYPVLVVDSSPDNVFAAAHAAFGPTVAHVRPDPQRAVRNGKVSNVMTGFDLVATDVVVIADDDVRHTVNTVDTCVQALADASLVRPQNYFVPGSGERLPWHVSWDTARTLLNRVSGGDLPGTLAVRMDVLRRTRGYDGNVLFENLELIRTIEVATQGTTCGCLHRPDIYVPRRPPTTRHFFGQRVRQAYDEFARPRRLVAQLAVAPAVLALAHRRSWPLLGAAVAATVVAAEFGRLTNGGRRHFPVAASFCAPAWLLERGACSWLAVGARLRGGVTYAGGRLAVAAHSPAEIRRLLSRPQRHPLAVGSDVTAHLLSRNVSDGNRPSQSDSAEVTPEVP